MIAYQELLSRHGNDGMLGDAVYAVLRGCILDGLLGAGSPLRIDRLAKEMGVSRTPVREALRRLESESFVVATPRKGLVVRGMSEEDLVEIFQIREVLEGQAARLAAQRLSPMDVVVLEHLVKEMSATKESAVEEFRDLTGQVYLRIAQAAGNERLRELILELQDRVRQFGDSTLFMPGKCQDTLKEIRQLVAALKAQNGARAEEVARGHRRRTLEVRLNARRESGLS